MHNSLAKIIQAKQHEVAALKQSLSRSPQGDLAKIMSGDRDFLTTKKSVQQALAYTKRVKVIAEIKRSSPSKGNFALIPDPLALAKQYVIGQAAAISVLTDSFFGGNLNDLQHIAAAPETSNLPVLRKDFLLDPLQIAESLLYGADIVLLIVGVLGDKLPVMLQKARELNMPALVEVYNYDEIQRALDSGAEIIAVNNRNLRTFEIDTNNAFKLAGYLPDYALKIAASGIFQQDLARAYHQAGYAAVLVGEALVKSAKPADWIAGCTT